MTRSLSCGCKIEVPWPWCALALNLKLQEHHDLLQELNFLLALAQIHEDHSHTSDVENQEGQPECVWTVATSPKDNVAAAAAV
jgi:hypothetical protein